MPSPKAPLSHPVSHKVFLKTLGQTSVALQKYGPKGRTLRDWRGKGGSVGAYTQKDNETKKRGTMSKAGQGGLLFTSLYIIYTMNCAPRYVSIQKMKKTEPRLPSMGPWPFHWVFPAPSQLPRSTFQLVTMSSKQSPKVPLALSEFPWLGWIEAIPSESLFRRCAPKRQPSVSTWLLVDEPPLFMGMKPHIPKLTWALIDCLRTFSSRGLAGWYTWPLYTAVTRTSWPQLWHFGQVWPSWKSWWQMNCSCPQPLSWSKINHKIP